MKIDAHQHFWQYSPTRDAWISEEMSILRHDYMPADLAPILQKNGTDGCIAVQADQSETETKFLLDLAEKNDFIKGVVGWIDLRSNNLEERLDFFSKNKKLKGFRHILQGEKSEFMLQPDFLSGVKALGKRGLTYDILVFPKHLTAVKQFLRHLEGQPFVLDHLAKPYIKRGLIQQWKKDIRSIAKHENIYCKISGMVTEANWTTWKTTDFEPYLEVVLEAFGPKRLMYGSDWPVCLLAADYERQLDLVKGFISKLTPTEQAQVMGLTAASFYKI
jgi:L-fuconolactonase